MTSARGCSGQPLALPSPLLSVHGILCLDLLDCMMFFARNGTFKHTYWTNAGDFDLRHRAKALRCRNGDQAAEPGKGQMGNMR